MTKTPSFAITVAVFLASLALALAVSSPLDAQSDERTGVIVGTVIDGATRRPVASATVRLLDGSSVSTGEDGRFSLTEVAPGVRRLEVTALGYVRVEQSDVVVTPGRPTAVRIELPVAALALEGVAVRSSEFVRSADVPTTEYRMSYEEIRRSPGAIGDVFRLLQSLPGVVTADDQRNDVIARGGSPAENLILVDNVEVPNLNHFAAQGTTGGPISMLNNEFVEDATFLAGGFPAQYGNRLSSVVDIRLREGSRERLLAEATVDFGGAGLIVEGPLGENGSWFASARQSYLALLAGPFGLDAIPYTTNAQFKANWEPDAKNRIWLIGIGGRDNIEFTADPDDLDEPSLEDVRARGWRGVVGANWQRLLGDRGYAVLGVSDAYGTFRLGVWEEEFDWLQTFRNRSDEGETTAKLDVVHPLAEVADVRAGISVKRFRQTYEIALPYGRGNPYSTDPTRVDTLEVDDRSVAWLASGYVQGNRALGQRAELTLGARVDRFGAVDATRVSPRAGLTVHLTDALDASVSYGRYHQQPGLVFISAVPQNRDLLPMRADHWVGALSWLPRAGLRVTAEAYVKEYADYPVSVDYETLSLANSGDVYGVGDLLFPMVSRGEGRSRGIELYAQQKLTDRFYGQVSYAYARAEHAALDGVMRRGGFDMPHVLNLIAGFKPSPAWEVSSRLSWSSGRPYTPILEAGSADQNRLIYDLERANAARTRAYQRLDLRADRRFTIGRAHVTAFLEIQNALDRENVFRLEWNQKTARLQEQNQISFLPIVGFNVRF